MATTGLLSLPLELFELVASSLPRIEDLFSLASTCTQLRAYVTGISPRMVLRAAAASNLFQPSPLLATAVAREVGQWARLSDKNERKLAVVVAHLGVQGIVGLALQHCGLPWERVRQLQSLKFSLISPVQDLVDKYIGYKSFMKHDRRTPDEPYTKLELRAYLKYETSDTLFHLVLYGELFAPDFEPVLNGDKTARKLSVATRLEFIKYCIPDHKCFTFAYPGPDPRRATRRIGPYKYGVRDHRLEKIPCSNRALSSLIQNIGPLYRALRARADVSEFDDKFEEKVYSQEGFDANKCRSVESFNSDRSRSLQRVRKKVPALQRPPPHWPGDSEWVDTFEEVWQQLLLESIMLCQGLDGLGMLVSGSQDLWLDRIREWKKKIAKLDQKPATTIVVGKSTYEYPCLLLDLCICVA
ncbi:hypothetical protein F4777DRAFT_579671 [Nemania sp. FL0916]|nr:hypothetical protein F4777DRAFT_579671 [Nemania sp. FL0916]